MKDNRGLSVLHYAHDKSTEQYLMTNEVLSDPE